MWRTIPFKGLADNFFSKSFFVRFSLIKPAALLVVGVLRFSYK